MHGVHDADLINVYRDKIKRNSLVKVHLFFFSFLFFFVNWHPAKAFWFRKQSFRVECTLHTNCRRAYIKHHNIMAWNRQGLECHIGETINPLK